MARFGCLSTLLSLFSELDLALNPLSFLRTSQKLAVARLEAQNLELTNSITSLTRSFQLMQTEFFVLKANMEELVSDYSQVRKELGELADPKLDMGETQLMHRDLLPASIYDSPRLAPSHAKIPVSGFVQRTVNLLKQRKPGYGILAMEDAPETENLACPSQALNTIVEENIETRASGAENLSWPYYRDSKLIQDEDIYWDCSPSNTPLLAPPLPVRPARLKNLKQPTEHQEIASAIQPHQDIASAIEPHQDIASAIESHQDIASAIEPQEVASATAPQKPPRLYTALIHHAQDGSVGGNTVVVDVRGGEAHSHNGETPPGVER